MNRTLPVRQHRAIFGHSASSTLPFSLAKKRPGVFGLVGSFALLAEIGDESLQSYDAAQFPLRFWIWHGRKGSFEIFSAEATAARLEELGWDCLFYDDPGGHEPGIFGREAFLKYVSQGFAQAPLLQSPKVDFSSATPLVVGAPIELTVTVRPGLLEGESQTARITADLSELGGPDAVSLSSQADGTYRGTTSFTVMPTVTWPFWMKNVVGEWQLETGDPGGDTEAVTFGDAPPGFHGPSAGIFPTRESSGMGPGAPA